MRARSSQGVEWRRLVVVVVVAPVEIVLRDFVGSPVTSEQRDELTDRGLLVRVSRQKSVDRVRLAVVVLETGIAPAICHRGRLGLIWDGWCLKITPLV